MSPDPDGARVPPGRLVLVALALAYFVAGPIVRHLTRWDVEAVPGWFMFTGAYTRTCQVEFYVREGASDRRIHSDDVIGRGRRVTLHAPEEIRETAGALCEALGPDADLRADARCGSRAGWIGVFERERDLCSKPR